MYKKVGECKKKMDRVRGESKYVGKWKKKMDKVKKKK